MSLFGAFLLPVFVAVGVLAAFHVRSPLTGVFMVVWFAIVLGNGYLLLFRVAYRLEVRGRALHWYAPLRRGIVPVAQVTAVTPFFNPSVLVIRTETGVSPLMYPRRGFPAFLRALSRLNPMLPERLPASTRFFSGIWR
jgi:hypothetical protein